MTLATWWTQATPGVNYWRADIPAKHLPGQTRRLHERDYHLDASGEPVLEGQEGTAIFLYPGNATRALIMANLITQGVCPVLMEVDDNYLVPPPDMPGFTSSWGRKLRTPDDRYSHQAHRRIAQWVDGITVTTPTLADEYERATAAPVFVCPNSVDPEDWPALSRQAGPLRVGYAGSDSHLYDLALVDRALDWAWRNGTELWKLGARTAVWRYPHKQIPWTDDLNEYRQNLQILDVALCPLKRSRWADCKSDIKAMEAIMAGALPVVQADSPVYSDWVGKVPSATTPKQWLRTLREVVSMSDSERHEIWAGAHQWLLDHKTIRTHIRTWREACTPAYSIT